MTWELDDRNCIRLFSPNNYTLENNKVFNIRFDGLRYEFDEDVVGIPFMDKQCTGDFYLYHPEGSFRWRGAREPKLTIKSRNAITLIPKGLLLAKVKLMSIQFFNLMKKHDNSDKGLQSASIKIELINETI